MENVLQKLDREVASFDERNGRLPKHITELVWSGQLTAIPDDPLGGDIYMGEDGRTYSTSQEHRLEVYQPLKDGLKK